MINETAEDGLRSKKKIVLNAIHPAPYIDNWIETIRETYEVVTVYNYAASAAKTWSDYRGEPGVVVSNTSLIKLARTYAAADLVIFSGWFEPRNLWAIIALALTQTKVAVFSDYPKETRKSGLNILLKKILIGFFIDVVLCATRSTSGWYAETLGVPQRKLRLFPYGLSGLTVNKSSEGVPTTEGSIDEHDTFHVFIANNFRPIKGYATILDSLRRLKKKDVLDKFSFTIAGAGEEFDSYSKKFSSLNGKIKLLGWIEVAKYEEYMKSADIFVHASNFEPFGIPPLDAISVGTPVVVSSGVQSVSGMIENGRSGYLFEKGSGKELADALMLAYAERRRLPEVAQEALTVLKREFTPEQWLAAVDTIFDNGLAAMHADASK